MGYVVVAPDPGKIHGEQAKPCVRRREAENCKAIGWEGHPMKHMPLGLVSDPAQPGSLRAGVRRGDVWHSPDRGEPGSGCRSNFEGSGAASSCAAAEPAGGQRLSQFAKGEERCGEC